MRKKRAKGNPLALSYSRTFKIDQLPITTAFFGGFRFGVVKFKIIKDDRFIVLAFSAGEVHSDHRCIGDHVFKATRPVGQDMVGWDQD